MPTSKPLIELIPSIIEHYNINSEYLEFNLRLYRILEGQVKTEVENSLRQEILSRSALNRALQRIPSLNVLKKATDKLSRVYIEQPLRTADNDSDKDIIKNIVNESKLDNAMTCANRFLNAQNTFAIEPYVKDGKHQFRTLAGHQFLPYSDDVIDPTNMTVFIKLMGSVLKEFPGASDVDGNKDANTSVIRLVDILWLYSDDEFLIIDSTGDVRYDLMEMIGNTNGRNPFGKIPFIVGNKSKLELLPFPNQAGLDISVLIPKLLTDLNYAAQFMSHSIIWTRNADLSGQEVNPDTIVDLGDSTTENGDPDIGTITPTVDIVNTIGLIEFELTAYFSTIGIKTDFKANGGSGVSKAIDEGDITAEYKIQTEFFKEIEGRLWDLVDTMQSVWAKENKLYNGDRKLFSDSFTNTFRIQFKEIKVLKTHQQMLDEIKTGRELKLISRRQALRELKPELTEDQITTILEEISAEAEADFEELMDMSMPEMPAPLPTDPNGKTVGRKDDGKFQKDNQLADEQPPENNLEARLGK